MIRISDIMDKEVINVKNGKRMGYITDIDMDINEGKIIPAPQNKLPLKPSRLFPTNNAVFSEIGPGADCASASISINSSSPNHSFLLTTSFRIKGIMAYPPPKVKTPILKKTKNRSQYCFSRLIINLYIK